MNIIKDLKILEEEFKFEPRGLQSRKDNREEIENRKKEKEKQEALKYLKDQEKESISFIHDLKNRVNDSLISVCSVEKLNCSDLLKKVLKKEMSNGFATNIITIDKGLGYGLSCMFALNNSAMDRLDRERRKKIKLQIEVGADNLISWLKHQGIKFIVQDMPE